MKKNIILLPLFFLLVSCESFSASIRETFEPAREGVSKEEKPQPFEKEFSETEVQKQPIASSIEALDKAEEQLRKLPQFQGEKIIIFNSVHFYSDGRINLKIQVPNHPRNIDQYSYRNGSWEEPKPVQISISDEIESRSIDLDDVPFRMANKVYLVIHEKASELDIEAPKTVYFIPRKGKAVWYPKTLNTERSQYRLDFDSEGNLLLFEQS